jgi:hypothetical protein
MSIMRIRTVISGSQGLPGLSTTYANGAGVTPITADAADMVARVRAFWDGIKALLPNTSIILVSGQVDLLDPANGELSGGLSTTAPGAVLGTGTESLPQASAILLQCETGVIIAGRRLRGRTFISPVDQVTNVDGLVSSTSRSTIITSATVSLTGVTTSVPVVWHRPSAAAPSGGSVSPVTSYNVGSNFAVLRSRRD